MRYDVAGIGSCYRKIHIIIDGYRNRNKIKTLCGIRPQMGEFFGDTTVTQEEIITIPGMCKKCLGKLHN